MTPQTESEGRNWLQKAYNEAENNVERAKYFKVAYDLNLYITVQEEPGLFESFGNMFNPK